MADSRIRVTSSFIPATRPGKAYYTNTATLVVDAFYLTPTTNFVSQGEPGLLSSYSPSNATYVLSNATPGILNFSAFTSNNWDTISATVTGTGSINQVTGNTLTGSVPGFGVANITVSLDANVNSLVNPGSYDDYLTISNASANTQLATIPEIILQVGFGIFDDFSTYAVGNVVGQNNWRVGTAAIASPVQIVNATLPGGTIASNMYVVPGGCPSDTGSAQQPYKYVSSGPLTNELFGCVTNITGCPINCVTNITGCVANPTYAITGVLITFTNAPTASNYVFEQGSTGPAWNDAGIEANGGGYSWTTELDAYQTGGGPEGSAIYNFNQQYQVFFVTDFGESNAWVFVNPPGPSIDPTAEALVNDSGVLSTNLAVYSNGAGADACPGADCIGTNPQGWESITLGQYSSCPGTVQPGYFVTRVAASTNYADVWNWLNPSQAPTCSPPTASFTPASASGAAPLTVQFTDSSTPNSGTLTAWSWTFGDGGTSTLQSPSYVYATPGTYTASLVVSNSCGDSSTNSATATISVYDPFAWWQQHYGLTGALSGGNASYTGDGMSNTNKFMAGFSPTNAAAYLHIISISKAVVAGSTNVTVTYLGASGDNTYTPGIASRTNILEYSTGTGNGSYTNSFLPTGQTNILSGGTGLGTNASMTDSGIPAVSDRYYRVRVLLP